MAKASTDTESTAASDSVRISGRVTKHIGQANMLRTLRRFATRAIEHFGIEVGGSPRPGSQLDRRQQTVVIIVEPPFQQDGQVGVVERAESAPQNKAVDDIKDTAPDRDQHHGAELPRRLEQPIEGQRSPKGDADHRHDRREPFGPNVTANAQPQRRQQMAMRGASGCVSSSMDI